jgi:hypothetical protein
MPKLDASGFGRRRNSPTPKARPKSLQCIKEVQMLLPQAPGLGIFHCVINDLENDRAVNGPQLDSTFGYPR